MVDATATRAATGRAVAARVHTRRGGGRWARRALVGPSVVTILVLGAYPLAFILVTAFADSTLGKPFRAFNGVENFTAVLSDADAVASFLRVAVYSVGVTLASVVIGVAVALALDAGRRSGSIVRTVLLLPLIMPAVVVGQLFKLIFNPAGGLLVTLLAPFGVSGQSLAILSSPEFAMVGVAIADVWEWTPLVVLLVFAALLGRDREVDEAASLDGAHGWRRVRLIVLPSVAGTIAAAAFIRLVLALKVFDLVAVMTAGGPGTATTTPSYFIEQAALDSFDTGRGSALTLLFAVLVTLLTLPVAALTRRLNR